MEEMEKSSVVPEEWWWNLNSHSLSELFLFNLIMSAVGWYEYLFSYIIKFSLNNVNMISVWCSAVAWFCDVFFIVPRSFTQTHGRGLLIKMTNRQKCDMLYCQLNQICEEAKTALINHLHFLNNKCYIWLKCSFFILFIIQQAKTWL